MEHLKKKVKLSLILPLLYEVIDISLEKNNAFTSLNYSFFSLKRKVYICGNFMLLTAVGVLRTTQLVNGKVPMLVLNKSLRFVDFY